MEYRYDTPVHTIGECGLCCSSFSLFSLFEIELIFAVSFGFIEAVVVEVQIPVLCCICIIVVMHVIWLWLCRWGCVSTAPGILHSISFFAHTRRSCLPSLHTTSFVIRPRLNFCPSHPILNRFSSFNSNVLLPSLSGFVREGAVWARHLDS